ncbi:MAG: Gldg family protein [Clostridia bacterium]|nr:Gldg family protein [Clostridia bacterium]
MKKLLLRRKTVHTLLCLLAVLLCVMLSLLADTAEKKNGLRLDLSFNAITTHSEETEKLLSSLQEKVHVYALFSAGNEDRQLIELLNRYAAVSDQFTWTQENLTRNPLLSQIVSSEVGDGAVSSDCLVVRCEATGRTRILSGSDYVQYSYNMETGAYEASGWTYEKSLSEAILYVTSDELPLLQFLTGHDELDADEAAAMEEKLKSANYRVSRINLSLGDIPDPAAPLFILSPRKDLTEQELNTLHNFARLGGNFFITADFDDPDQLPRFFSLYREYGFEPIPGIVVADENDRRSYYYNNSQLLPQMLPGDVTDYLYANEFTQIIMVGARGFEMPKESTSALITYPCLVTGDTAYIRDFDENLKNEEISVAKQPGDRVGQFALAVTADRAFSDGTRSKAFIIGSSAIFTDKTGFMYANTYSGELLLYAAQYVSGAKTVSLDILPREVVRPQLGYSDVMTPALLLTLAPLTVLVAAVAVLKPRKHL